MTTIEDGGPAFPWDDLGNTHDQPRPCAGMTLRDWFAGQALNGCQRPSADGSEYSTAADTANAAYALADAMIQARKGAA